MSATSVSYPQSFYYPIMSIVKRFLCLCALCLALPAFAQVAAIDMDFAFHQLKTNGSEPFAKALYEANPECIKPLVAQLSPLIKDRRGYIGYEELSRARLGKRLERVVYAIHFENGPIFLRLDFYDNGSQRICLPAVVSREASEVLPFDLISAAGK